MSDLDDLSRASRALAYAPPAVPGPRPDRNRSTNLIVIGASLLIAACFIGYMNWAERQREIASGPATAVGAADLLEQYLRNEVAADARYRHRVVEVSGPITQVHRQLNDEAFVDLGPRVGVRTIHCTFRRSEEPSLAQVNPGDTLTVRGECAGLWGTVNVTDCLIVIQKPARRAP